MLNARQLEFLNAVIENGTTARAASVLNVSQPAVSNMIRHMESRTGLTLFSRVRGRLIPTPEAQYIANEARQLFMQEKRVKMLIKELREGTTGKLDIIATPSIGLGVLPRALAKFAHDKPKLRVALELGSIDEITDMLTSGRSDIGFSITKPRHPSLTVHQIAKGKIICVCAPNHEFATRKKVRIADLNTTRHVSYSTATPLGQLIDKVFSDLGMKREYAWEVRHTATALQIAITGFGVALIDSFAMIEHDEPGVVVKDTEPELPIQMHSIVPMHYPTSSIAGAFMRFFADYVDGRTADET